MQKLNIKMQNDSFKLNYIFRNFSDPDKNKVSELMRALYIEDAGGPDITQHKIDKTLGEFELHLDKGSVVVIESGGDIIGYAVLVNFWSNQYGGNVVIIDELYVKPEYRSKGIGKALIEEIIGKAKQTSVAVQLEVHSENPNAKKLYESLGFKEGENLHLIFTF